MALFVDVVVSVVDDALLFVVVDDVSLLSEPLVEPVPLAPMDVVLLLLSVEAVVLGDVLDEVLGVVVLLL